MNKKLTTRANKGETEDVKAPSAGAKSLCIPHDQARFGEFPDGENQKCVQCGEKAKRWTLFGRSKSLVLCCRGNDLMYRLLDIGSIVGRVYHAFHASSHHGLVIEAESAPLSSSRG